MDVFDLKAILSLDSSGFDSGLDKAGATLGKVGGALKTGFSTIAKVGTVAIGTATAGVIGLTKASVQGYAEFEQLEGGIETLYGEHSAASAKMMESAKNAWKTAGLSVNDYMNTAIESSAAMISSLSGDTDKAAELMDMSITDMSDNVNKMGTSMEAIQNAYRGFSRGNFTMLDNLALGFAGTKEGMQQLLDKAKEISGIEYDISSYADIVQAIHVVQDEMGIAGTTAKEASETISGSLAATKSAWTNLVTGITDPNADIGKLIDDLVASASTAMDNLLPAIEHALSGISSFIEQITPKIVEELPGLVDKILPPLLNSATTLVAGIANALPSMITVIAQQIPNIISQLGTAIVNAGGELLWSVSELLRQVYLAMCDFDWSEAGQVIGEKLGEIFDPDENALKSIAYKGFAIVEQFLWGLSEAMPGLVEGAAKFIEGFGQFLSDDAEDAPHIIEAAMSLISSLAKSLGDVAPELIPSAIESILNEMMKLLEGDGISKMIEGAIALLTGLAEALINSIPIVIEKIPEILVAIVNAIIENAPKLLEGAISIMQTLADGLMEEFPIIGEAINELGVWFDQFAQFMQPVVDAFKAGWEFIKTLFETIKNYISTWITNHQTEINSFISTIKLIVEGFITNIKTVVGIAVDFFKITFKATFDVITGIFKAATALLKGDVKGAAEAIKGIINTHIEAGKKAFNSLKEHLSSWASDMKDKFSSWGRDMIQNFINGIKEKIGRVKDAVGEIADTVRSYLHFSEPDVGPLSDFSSYAPDMMALFAKGIKDNEKLVRSQIGKSFDFGDMITGVDATNTQMNKGASGPITINVYGSEGQSVKELAEAVGDVLMHELNVKQMAMA